MDGAHAARGVDEKLRPRSRGALAAKEWIVCWSRDCKVSPRVLRRRQHNRYAPKPELVQSSVGFQPVGEIHAGYVRYNERRPILNAATSPSSVPSVTSM